MSIILNGTTGITTPDITSTAGFDSADLTGDIATARITGALNATGSAPVYACRAWVNFNGTGTVAIRASGNVSSITDNGVGDYTINFTTAMPDASYSSVVTCGTSTGAGNLRAATTLTGLITSAAFRFQTCSSNGTTSDVEAVYASIFR
jgi:hypothetical protein